MDLFFSLTKQAHMGKGFFIFLLDALTLCSRQTYKDAVWTKLPKLICFASKKRYEGETLTNASHTHPTPTPPVQFLMLSTFALGADSLI